MTDPEINNIEWYNTAYKQISSKLDEYIKLHYGDSPIIDTGSQLDVYCYVLDKLISKETEEKHKKICRAGGH